MADYDFCILALDLSLNCSGYAVLHYEHGFVEIIEKGVINNKKIPSNECPKKLNVIRDKIDALLKTYKTKAVAKERGFSNGNARAGQQLYKVHGVADEVSFTHGFIVDEIATTSIKKNVGGNGKCTKEDVENNLPYYVGKQKYKTNDESDAVAVGLTWLMLNGFHVDIREVA